MKNRIVTLDILRAIASLSVLFTHFSNPFIERTVSFELVNSYHKFIRLSLWANGGVHGGVVIFIVLSGFCIHLSAAKNQSQHINFRKYYIRRYVRILPVLISAIIFGYVLKYMRNPIEMNIFVRNFISNIFFLPVFVKSFSNPLGNGILITVMCECVLYAVYPFLFRHLRRKRWALFIIILGMIYTMNILSVAFFGVNSSTASKNIYSFLLLWWIGAGSAELSFRLNRSRYISGGIFLFLMIIYMVICYFGNRALSGFHYLGAVGLAMLTAYGLMVMKFYEFENPVQFPRFSLGNLFEKIGLISYSIYVVHWPIILWMKYFLQTNSLQSQSMIWAVITVTFLLILIASISMYIFIEKPSHRKAIQFSRV